jgi:hypothetical protein
MSVVKEKDDGGGGSERSGSSVKSVKIVHDEQGNVSFVKSEAKGNEVKMSKVYGNSGTKRCLICKCFRDHYAKECPGNVCNKCDERGHWARECPNKPCSWCGGLGHLLVNCPEGGSSYVAGINKRRAVSEDVPEAAAKQSRMSVNGRSYGDVAKGKAKGNSTLPLVETVDNFVEGLTCADSLQMTDEIVERRRAVLLQKRKEVEERYRREMAVIDEEEVRLEEEIESEKEYAEAIRNLAALKEKRRLRCAKRTVAHPTLASVVKLQSAVEGTARPVRDLSQTDDRISGGIEESLVTQPSKPECGGSVELKGTGDDGSPDLVEKREAVMEVTGDDGSPDPGCLVGLSGGRKETGDDGAPDPVCLDGDEGSPDPSFVGVGEMLEELLD